ncbi:MAG: cysteine hydrolase [Mollicutes bacterium]|nr:cysteine hydrolase [Mollicutes bacterium]
MKKEKLEMKRERLEKIKDLLIIVDMVNGFVREGNMADPYIAHIIPEQLRLINMFQRSDAGIAFIKDNHELGCSEFKRYPEHCVIGTKEAELIDEFKPFEKDALVYPKNSTSAMFAPGFVSDIEQMKYLREVVIAGCCTDICDINLAIPLQNYFDEFNRDVRIVVPTNAVETYDAPGHSRDEYTQMAYKLMDQAGIQLVKKYERRR